jgi:hypothetical protein
MPLLEHVTSNYFLDFYVLAVVGIGVERNIVKKVRTYTKEKVPPAGNLCLTQKPAMMQPTRHNMP